MDPEKDVAVLQLPPEVVAEKKSLLRPLTICASAPTKGAKRETDTLQVGQKVGGAKTYLLV